MNNFIKKWIQDRKGNSEELVTIIPGDLFFITSAPLPEGKLKKDVLENIASVALEESSPFSSEDLFWGYFRDSSNLYIFSALKSRILGMEPLDGDSEYLFPSFIATLLLNVPTAVVKYRDGQILVSRTANNGFSVSSASGKESDYPCLEIMQVTASTSDGVRFRIKKTSTERPLGKIHEIVLDPLKDERLCSCNIQTPSSKKLLLRQKQQSSVCFILTCLSCVISIGLLGCSFFLKNTLSGQERIAASLKAKDAKVEQIRQKADRTEELDLFSNKKHVYIKALDRINELRPGSVIFNSLNAFEGENFVINCNAQLLEDIERFKKSLEDSSDFKTVKIENKQMRDNQTIDFSLSLTF